MPTDGGAVEGTVAAVSVEAASEAELRSRLSELEGRSKSWAHTRGKFKQSLRWAKMHVLKTDTRVSKRAC